MRMASKDTDDEANNAPALDWMKCNICLDKFSQPRVLPCLHTFCHSCLDRHTDFYCTGTGNREQNVGLTRDDERTVGLRSLIFTNTQGVYNEESFNSLRDRLANLSNGTVSESTRQHIRQRNNTFPCPTCREKTKLPSNGINGFRHDFRVSQLQEWMDKMRERNNKLEKEHKKRLTYIAKTVNEQEIPLECSFHPKETLTSICLDCSVGICSSCLNEFHQNHSLTPVSEGLDLYRESMKSLCTAMAARSSQLSKISEKLHDREKEISKQEKKILEKIREASEETIRSVREEEKKLTLELKDRSTSSAAIIKTLRSQIEKSRQNMNDMRQYSMSAATGALSPDMMSSYQDLVTQMDSILEDSLMLGSGDVNITALQFIKAKGKLKLGKIKHKEQVNVSNTDFKPNASVSSPKVRKRDKSRQRDTFALPSQPHVQLISCLGKQGSKLGEFNSPGDVCFLGSSGRNPSESFIVADTNNNRLQIFNTYGTLVKVLGEGQIRPWGISITKDRNIAVSDTLDKCIKIYNMDGLCLQKFGKFLCPCGIAVDSDGNFAVTDFFSASVYVIDITGKVLRKFDFRTDSDMHMSGRSHICISENDSLIISDISNGSIKIFSKSGQLIKQMLCEDVEMSSNSGVCVDHMGNILIADTLGSKITILNKKGEFHSHVDCKSGLRRSHVSTKQGESGFSGDPTGLAISSKGNLVLSYSKANQVSVYKMANKNCTLLLKVDQPDQIQHRDNGRCPIQAVKF